MVRRVRLWSGLVLTVFVVTHYLNHALGLVGLEALDAGRQAFLWLWRSLPGTLLLYGALIVHMVLAFWSLFQRRRLSMPVWEAVQLVVGLAIPPLLVLHILGNRLAAEVFATDDTYIYDLLIYFVFSPTLLAKQIFVTLLAWLHACIGLHYWLRLKPGYRRLLPLAYALAIVIPTVALAGVMVAGRDVAQLAQDPDWLAAAMERINFPDERGVALIYAIENWFYVGFAAALVLVLAARPLRAWWQRRHGIVTLTYPDGKRVSAVKGTTILETSRGAGIPHASVCGGRGRCSTCRVRLGGDVGALPEPSEEEARVLGRIGAAPNVRLACQTRPSADLEVTPLLPPAPAMREIGPKPGYLQGQEREIAILFADLRGFTSLSEDKLPFDVVFILNRYFAAMGLAVEESGGRVDKFIGDGVMALFGIESDHKRGCVDALTAARRMSERLLEINAALKHDLGQPLRIGIGIHTGPVIVGEMGYGQSVSVTAIGDAVNTA
ncbi:MAG: adenylate/guanylate cyclase domain-containing protein, partial [Kiloniellales bacterium]|nr:adenylate/guanylate cyclase domain-containing protein [Kiloniellales bacterium]